MTSIPDPQAQPDFYANVATKRLLAWVVDMVVIVLVCVLILPFTAFTGLFFFPLLLLVVGFVYRVMTIANRSATWGMRLMAIEFRHPDGSPFNFGTALIHTLGYSMSWAIFPCQLISVIMMASTERGQGLTDMVMGTVAINRGRAV